MREPYECGVRVRMFLCVYGILGILGHTVRTVGYVCAWLSAHATRPSVIPTPKICEGVVG